MTEYRQFLNLTADTCLPCAALMAKKGTLTPETIDIMLFKELNWMKI